MYASTMLATALVDFGNKLLLHANHTGQDQMRSGAAHTRWRRQDPVLALDCKSTSNSASSISSSACTVLALARLAAALTGFLAGFRLAAAFLG